MKIRLVMSTMVVASSLMLAPTNMASASTDGISLRIKVSGHVATQCELRTDGAYEQISQDVFRIGSVDRFCNTAHQMILAHNASTNGGMITFDGLNVPLQDTQVILVANGEPVDRQADIIISGIDTATAQDIAESLQLQIIPRNL